MPTKSLTPPITAISRSYYCLAKPPWRSLSSINAVSSHLLMKFLHRIMSRSADQPVNNEGVRHSYSWRPLRLSSCQWHTQALSITPSVSQSQYRQFLWTLTFTWTALWCGVNCFYNVLWHIHGQENVFCKAGYHRPCQINILEGHGWTIPQIITRINILCYQKTAGFERAKLPMQDLTWWYNVSSSLRKGSQRWFLYYLPHLKFIHSCAQTEAQSNKHRSFTAAEPENFYPNQCAATSASMHRRSSLWKRCVMRVWRIARR